MMRAVAGPPKAPPPPNPNSPLSLADARFWDALLADAGFEFTDDHNFQEAVYFDLGNDEQSFKVAALPIWDTLAEMEASGSMPDAWAKAQSAFPKRPSRSSTTAGTSRSKPSSASPSRGNRPLDARALLVARARAVRARARGGGYYIQPGFPDDPWAVRAYKKGGRRCAHARAPATRKPRASRLSPQLPPSMGRRLPRSAIFSVPLCTCSRLCPLPSLTA